MSKMKKDTTVLGLYVTTKREHGFLTVNAHPVTIGPTAWERQQVSGTSRVYAQTVRNPSGFDLVNGLRLADLRVVSQGSDDGRERGLYGYDVVYHDVYHVNQRDANEMSKTLNTVQKRLSKLEDRFGHPASFGAYVARVAAAIGATQLVFVDDSQRVSGDYSEDKHRFYSVRDGVFHVDRKVSEWVHELDVKVEATA